MDVMQSLSPGLVDVAVIAAGRVAFKHGQTRPKLKLGEAQGKRVSRTRWLRHPLDLSTTAQVLAASSRVVRLVPIFRPCLVEALQACLPAFCTFLESGICVAGLFFALPLFGELLLDLRLQQSGL